LNALSSRWTLDLDAAHADPADEIFFDAASTQLRAGLLQRAIAAGKHVYCEKPVADVAVNSRETPRCGFHAATGSGASCAALTAAGVW